MPKAPDFLPKPPPPPEVLLGTHYVRICNSSELTGLQQKNNIFEVGSATQASIYGRNAHVREEILPFTPEQPWVELQAWQATYLMQAYGPTGVKGRNSLCMWSEQKEEELAKKYEAKRRGALAPPGLSEIRPSELLTSTDVQKRILPNNTWSVPMIRKFAVNNGIEIPEQMIRDDNNEVDKGRLIQVVNMVATSILKAGGNLQFLSVDPVFKQPTINAKLNETSDEDSISRQHIKEIQAASLAEIDEVERVEPKSKPRATKSLGD